MNSSILGPFSAQSSDGRLNWAKQHVASQVKDESVPEWIWTCDPFINESEW